jgi:ABC-type transporter Mla subunit MlaD
VESLTLQMETILGNIDTVTQELAAVDLGQMVQNVDSLVGEVGGLITDVSGLVTDSQGAVQDAVEKLNALDLDKLNKAIEDFAAIIEPLAKAARWLT